MEGGQYVPERGVGEPNDMEGMEYGRGFLMQILTKSYLLHRPIEGLGLIERMWERLRALVPDVSNIIIAAFAGDFNLVVDPKLDVANDRRMDTDSLALMHGMTSLGYWVSNCPQDNLLDHIMMATQNLRANLGRQLRGSYLAHQRTGEEYVHRMEDLDAGPGGEQTGEEWWGEHAEAVREWREWQGEEAVKWGRRTKETWISVGERMSREFFGTVGARKVMQAMTVMDHPFDSQKERQRTTRGILMYATDFCSQLLTEEEQWTSADMAREPDQQIWKHIQRRLNLKSICKLEEDIQPQEVERAIVDLPRLKVAGLDVLATHLKEILPYIIDHTQTGFVAGWQILSNVLQAQQILEEEQCTGQAMAFVSIDLEKAYDRVRWEFLLQGMACWGIGGIFCGWVRSLLKGSSTVMLINVVRSDKIAVTRSVRQGCPLSRALYVIYIESLHELLREDDRIMGLKVGPAAELRSTSTAFADDTGAVIPPTTQQLQVLKDDLAIFCRLICDAAGEPFPWQGPRGAYGWKWAEPGVHKVRHLWDEGREDWRTDNDMEAALPGRMRKRQRIAELRTAIPAQWVQILKEDQITVGAWVRIKGNPRPDRVYRVERPVQGDRLEVTEWRVMPGVAYGGLGGALQEARGRRKGGLALVRNGVDTVAVCEGGKGAEGQYRPFQLAHRLRDLYWNPRPTGPGMVTSGDT
ncbi:hypothetical protein CBR_g40086 [Chara braunii]|uniref:Reverse transcriptase domain-containing protein n=1 Tax=Chara braunii TaxID=69332 RepID=A0A388LSZ8_CHABU|nr:hypothetical protein CBR_g40086 [Chara braunii]|eukprot:GBG85444.1 hypothetical protein CBR_g40086 [Chara braunii]